MEAAPRTLTEHEEDNVDWKRIAPIGAALGVLVSIGIGLGGVASSRDAMAEGITPDPMAEGMASDGMTEAMAPDGMAEPGTSAAGTAGMAPEGTGAGMAPDPALSDGQIAMIAVLAGNVDISYAHLAMALSSDPAVRRFARTMLQDHAAVNEQAGALVQRLGVEPVESDVSRQLERDARAIIDELTGLRGADFDRRYAENELAYHEFVNTALRDQFIPGADNPEFRKALEGALTLFEAHEKLARDLVDSVGG